jgi:Sec-independent protein translocase protein TatA
MQIFNVGIGELLFILVLAFTVLGPKKAVVTARKIGVWVRNLITSPLWREAISASNEVHDLPRHILDDAELQSLVAELDLSAQEIKNTLYQAHLEAQAELSSLNDAFNSDFPANPEFDDPSGR